MVSGVPGLGKISSDALDVVDQAKFNLGLDEFFGTLVDKVESGEISADDAEGFFPEEVKSRCREETEETPLPQA